MNAKTKATAAPAETQEATSKKEGDLLENISTLMQNDPKFAASILDQAKAVVPPTPEGEVPAPAAVVETPQEEEKKGILRMIGEGAFEVVKVAGSIILLVGGMALLIGVTQYVARLADSYAQDTFAKRRQAKLDKMEGEKLLVS